MDKKKKLSGSQYRKRSQKEDLLKAASDPKQRKLSFEKASAGTDHAHETMAVSSELYVDDVPSIVIATSAAGEISSEGTSHVREREHQGDTDSSNKPAAAASKSEQDSPPQHRESSSTSAADTHQPAESADTRDFNNDDCFCKQRNLPMNCDESNSVCSDGDENLKNSCEFKNYENMAKFITPDKHAPQTVKAWFLKNHPVQPSRRSNGEKLDFDTNIYSCVLSNGELKSRQWLSFCETNNKLYCVDCMLFGDVDSQFKVGHDVSNKHVYKAVEIHEKSKSHNIASQAAFRCINEKTIENLTNKNLADLRKLQTQQRRAIVERLVDITLFVARQGIAYRGREESAHSLLNRETNHGNFLELVLLLKEYDPLLNNHVEKCIEISKEIRKAKEQSSKCFKAGGRGSFISFLSKTFTNKLITVIANSISTNIISQIKDAKYFSIMFDSTQDISVLEQCALCVRYVFNGEVSERLLTLLVSKDSTGKGMYKLVCDVFAERDVKLCNLIGCSFDGAPSMKGEFNGLQAHLKNDNSSLVYTHCLGHCLNLVMADTLTCSSDMEKLFGLVGRTSVFVNSSYKKIDIWKSVKNQTCTAHDLLKRLQRAVVTRWWSKDKALKSIVDFSQTNISESNFVIFLKFLNEATAKNSLLDIESKSTARSLQREWCDFKLLFTAYVAFKIFNLTTPVSNIFQSPKLNYLQAWNLVDTLEKNLLSLRTDEQFSSLLQEFKSYINTVNAVLVENDLDEFTIPTEFKEKRVSKKRVMTDTESCDEIRNFSTQENFKRDTFFGAIDVAVTQIRERFIVNKLLFNDLSCLDPQNFNEINENGLPATALLDLSKKISVNRDELCTELQQFSINFKSFFVTLQSAFQSNANIATVDTVPKSSVSAGHEVLDWDLDADEGQERDENNSEESMSQCKTNCSICVICAFSVVNRLADRTSSYNNLYLAYKYMLTLPCTQVSCERVFSTVKFVKNRLRSQISQENFNGLMTIKLNRDMSFSLNKQQIIDDVANTSDELKKLLLL